MAEPRRPMPQEENADYLYRMAIARMHMFIDEVVSPAQPPGSAGSPPVPPSDGFEEWSDRRKDALRQIGFISMTSRLTMKEEGVPMDDPRYRSLSDIANRSWNTVMEVVAGKLPAIELQSSIDTLYQKYFT